MRFSSAEIERAYSDYLDSLEDWPPPADELEALEELSVEMAVSMPASNLDEVTPLRKRSAPGSVHH